MQAVLVLPFVFLALAIHSGESIKCYVCDSANNEKCADTFAPESNANLLTECTPDIAKQAADAFNAASKKLSEFASSLGFGNNKPTTINTEFICAKLDLTNADKTWTVRQCTLPGTDKTDFCKQLTDLSKDNPNAPKVSFCETCDKDGCNGATSIQAAVLAIIVPCAALLLAHFH